MPPRPNRLGRRSHPLASLLGPARKGSSGTNCAARTLSPTMLAADATPAPDLRAEDIFTRTRVAFAARTYPSTLKYKVRISGIKGSTVTARTYDTIEHWPEETVHARSISEEEAANPVKPPQFCFFGIGAPKRAGLELPGILGIPKLAATYEFGPAPQGDATLKTIGSVRAVRRIYDVRLAGEETIDGSACWHLTLKPLGNPGTYRLRDLWVDEATYQTRQLVTDGNFTGKETGSGRWTVSYAHSGDAWYLSREVSNGSVSDGTGRFDSVSVEFLDVAPDRFETLDFGISGATKDVEVIEPPEFVPQPL